MQIFFCKYSAAGNDAISISAFKTFCVFLIVVSMTERIIAFYYYVAKGLNNYKKRMNPPVTYFTFCINFAFFINFVVANLINK
jgi:hypothetical protein